MRKESVRIMAASAQGRFYKVEDIYALPDGVHYSFADAIPAGIYSGFSVCFAELDLEL